ncbi:WPP domain-interacting tail-anchored protein 2-like [Cornus florida]|uniref:WPP domain-interacting tail-anchored protein 2-like n=1 Tax=Cornus florida TaxID=4283 RepID=UPI00289E63AB|nr:WPP domain-interacting tail-anchored protein 2-like [Cornus florida]
MDDYTAHNVDDDTELGKFYTHEGDTSDAKDTGEIESIMELLTRVDLDLAYSSEKLANLDTLLMHVMSSENALEAIAAEIDNSSEDLMEKALLFDLLSAILDSEVRDLDNFMRTLQAVIVDAHQKITSCRHLRELFIVMEVKLHDSEESLKKSKEEVFEIKMHLSKLQRRLFNFIHNDWKYDSLLGLSENGQVANVVMKPKLQTVDQQRHILRMLEKSLGRELHLEKKLSDSKQNEEDLKLKVRLTEQVALCMEEAAEVVWGRFLEAENAAEVLMGTSKELVGRLQIVQFNLNGSCQREDEANSKLFVCLEQLKSRENTFKKLESRISELIAENSEVCSLRERVKLLEEQLKKSEFQLKNANASIEANQEQLREMDHMVDSLKENIYIAESRVQTAEAKITRLTDTNVELTEELGFLKNNNDSDTKKVSLLEKQLRELEIQLQHARASSEASQEQQNMLYSAIWDMETLIEELKSKVSKADIKAENAEEQCVVLTETNLELNNELSFMRTRIESLETSLQQAEDAKATIAKDINVKTKFIMDMVMQLAIERERVKKQLYSLTVENKILVEKLQKTKGDIFASLDENLGADDDEFLSSKHDSSNATSTKPFEEAPTESSSRNFQVDVSPKDASACVTEVESSVSANDATNMVPELEADGTVEEGQHNRMCIFMAFIVLLLSVLATYMINKKPLLSDALDG